MNKKTKTYTTTVKGWLLHAGKGRGIGSQFLDHGKMMRIVSVGKAYRREGKKDRWIDIETVEVTREY